MELPFSKTELDVGVHEGTPQQYPNAIDVQLAALAGHVDKLTLANLKLWQRLNANTPVIYKVAGSVVWTSGQLNIISFGGPDRGTFWEIQNFALGGTDINVTAAGSFGLYVSGYQGTSSPGMGALVDGASAATGGAVTLPFTETYGSRQITVNEAEQLYAIVYNGTAGQTYVGNIQATVWNVAAGSGIDINAI
jgi:hypothetical protein